MSGEGYCDECCNTGINPCFCGGDFCVCGDPEPDCECCADGLPCACTIREEGDN